ncbi:hypothetical protein HIM_01340 [Hirsutella minnesotensis 3608]|nr:hypothetical protein HIM_01340 [Hirsutella minnesotensis 3608]
MSSTRRDVGDYQPVPGNEDAPARPSPSRGFANSLVIPLTAIISLSIGIVLGATNFLALRSTFASCPVVTLQGPASATGSQPDITLSAVEKPFTYNRTFGEDPRSNQATVEAWESIVPLGQGSVRFPSNSPHVYTLSVVHQLHCLWSIHGSYYGGSDARSDSGKGVGSAHMRHCFDYLRQSLMCASDVSLEPVDAKLGGVTGWGNVRVCRDYDQVRAWAEKNRVNNLRGFLQSPKSHHHGQ